MWESLTRQIFFYTDATKLHQFSTPSDFHSPIVDVEWCVDSGGRWMTGNRLKLISDKTPALLAGSRRIACQKITTWELVITIISSKAVSKISGSTLTQLCVW